MLEENDKEKRTRMLWEAMRILEEVAPSCEVCDGPLRILTYTHPDFHGGRSGIYISHCPNCEPDLLDGDKLYEMLREDVSSYAPEVRDVDA